MVLQTEGVNNFKKIILVNQSSKGTSLRAGASHAQTAELWGILEGLNL